MQSGLGGDARGMWFFGTICLRDVGGKRQRRRRIAEEFGAAQRVEPRQTLEIAADAKAAVADEIARAIEHRQSRQFHA